MAIFLSPSDGLALLDDHQCLCKQGQRYKEVDSEQSLPAEQGVKISAT